MGDENASVSSEPPNSSGRKGTPRHATYEEAEEETLRMLGVYRKFAERVHGVAGYRRPQDRAREVCGRRSHVLDRSHDGRWKSLQAGTSHHLGQNFAKAFDVTFQTQQGTREFVYATSWGLSTRMIGALIMAHGDDNGIVIPPRLATTQLAIVPDFRKPEEKERVMEVAHRIATDCKAIGSA
jgi:prolyl-tRNA synthetase